MKRWALFSSRRWRMAAGAAIVGAALILGCSTAAPTSAPSTPTLALTPTSTEATETTADNKDQPKVGYRVGDLAPDFTITTTDGRSVTLDDILADGKPFILFFFTTW